MISCFSPLGNGGILIQILLYPSIKEFLCLATRTKCDVSLCSGVIMIVLCVLLLQEKLKVDIVSEVIPVLQQTY